MGATAACAPATDCAIRETGGLSRVPGGWNCVQQPDVEHRLPRGVGATNTKASAVGGVGSLGQTNVLKRSEAWDDITSICDRRVALRDVTDSNDRCGSFSTEPASPPCRLMSASLQKRPKRRFAANDANGQRRKYRRPHPETWKSLVRMNGFTRLN